MKEHQCRQARLWQLLVGGPDINWEELIALNAAEYFQNAGIENYWQTTF